jgi:outer membrane protein assembly factor BamB
VDNLLFAPNSDGNLYVLDLNDGQTQKQPVAAIELGGQLWAQPVSDGERIFVSSIDHTVSAVDIKTLKVLWQENIEASVPGSPAIGADGMLYVGSLASVLEQFDPAGGDHKSVMDAKNWIWSSPTASGDSLYFGDIDGNFYSYNTAEGSLNWSNQPGGSITASAFARDDRVVVATETGYIYVIGADGKILWSKMIPNASGKGNAKIYTTPVVINDLYLAAPMDASFYLVAFDGDGRQVWTFTPAK